MQFLLLCRAVPGGTEHAVLVPYLNSGSMALGPWGTAVPSEPQSPIIIFDRAPLWKAVTGLERSLVLSPLFSLPSCPQPSSFLPFQSQLNVTSSGRTSLTTQSKARASKLFL